MKISYNWLKEYIPTGKSAEEIAAILTDTGLEVEGVSKSGDSNQLEGLVVGHVISCEKHPDADRLQLTQVDIGEAENLQIVCGAPNVSQGQKVCVATVGTTLYPTSGDPFKIKKGKIRGQVSMGMICAEDEIGIGYSHDGIMVLDSDAIAGQNFKTYLNQEDDYTLEIGLTPNRTDGFSHIGVARDLAAALNFMQGIEGEEGAAYHRPDVSIYQQDDNEKTIAVEVIDEEACPRYCGVTLTNVKVEASPDWLQDRLKSIGLAPINNVVDITNFVLHETGQPLHAFDADKIRGGKVLVKKLEEGNAFTTLDGIERELSSDDLMICDEQGGMCIAGVFGGEESGVSESTKSVFLESAYFNPVSVRQTAKRHILNTDASFRFERGVDPNGTIYALKRAALLIKDLCGASISSEIFDSQPQEVAGFDVNLDLNRLRKLSGISIPDDRVGDILAALDITIKKKTSEVLELEVAPYRVDVQREADVIEEVLRIYGYNNVPVPSKVKASLSYEPKVNVEELRRDIARMLAARGYFEIMNNSLTKSEYSELYKGDLESVQILNPLSSELGILRQDLIFGGLETIIRNINQRQEDLRLFEFGKVYGKVKGQYQEEECLSILLSGSELPENWNNSSREVSFASLKASCDAVFRALRLEDKMKMRAQSGSDLFEDGITYSVGKEKLAELGIVSGDILNRFGIKQKVLYASLRWERILKYLPKKALKFQELEKYPAVRRDLSLLLPKAVSFAEIEAVARKSEKNLLREVGLFDVYEGKNLDADKKSYALRFILRDSHKTLKDKQIEKSMANIQKALESELGAELRS